MNNNQEKEINELLNKKNYLLNINEFSKLYLSLKEDLQESYKAKEELSEVIKSFNKIDNTKSKEEKEKLIKGLDTKYDYKKYKNDILKANKFNDDFIENISNKVKDLEDNFAVVDNESILKNIELIKEIDNKIKSLGGDNDISLNETIEE